MESIPPPHTGFDWVVYADATFAGLSVLIPLPIVDWVFERFFRRRMPAVIAGHRGRKLPDTIVDRLNKGNIEFMSGCLLLPVKGIFKFLKRLSRKILYFLTVKEASDKISEYWHRAFLIDYMLQAGHLENEASARIARQAMDTVVSQTTTSPFMKLAWQITTGTRHVFFTLLRVRRGKEDEAVHQKESQMKQNWGEVEGYLGSLAVRYHQIYRELKTR